MIDLLTQAQPYINYKEKILVEDVKKIFHDGHLQLIIYFRFHYGITTPFVGFVF